MVRVMPAVVRGPLAAAVMERLAAWLVVEQYSVTMVPQILAVARGLSAWMDDHDVGLRGLTVEVLEGFGAGYAFGVPGHVIVGMRIPVVRRFLIEAGYLPTAVPARKRTRRPVAQPPLVVRDAARRELDEWGAWQRQARAIGEGCIAHRRQWVAGLVDSLTGEGGVDWGSCDAATVNAFIGQRGWGFSQASKVSLVDATRSLLRWALVSGRVDHDLTGGILRTAGTRASLPRGLSPVQVEALLAACDTGKRAGIRDRAVITMLWRLGLRAGEVAGLALDDIDWAAGRLTVIGKGQRRLTLPLPDDVGRVLVSWLEVRPTEGSGRALFTRVRPPIGSLTSTGISDIVKHRAQAAGLGVVHAHRLRHTAAMNVLAAGGSQIEAQELLGHHSVLSTRVYARTDLSSLRTLTVPFGQVPR